jgi:hypothetical protein
LVSRRGFAIDQQSDALLERQGVEIQVIVAAPWGGFTGHSSLK